MIEDIDKISFAYDIMSQVILPFAKLRWPVFFLLLHLAGVLFLQTLKQDSSSQEKLKKVGEFCWI